MHSFESELVSITNVCKTLQTPEMVRMSDLYSRKSFIILIKFSAKPNKNKYMQSGV